jgi:hypothetical protein
MPLMIVPWAAPDLPIQSTTPSWHWRRAGTGVELALASSWPWRRVGTVTALPGRRSSGHDVRIRPVARGARRYFGIPLDILQAARPERSPAQGDRTTSGVLIAGRSAPRGILPATGACLYFGRSG